MRVQHNIMAMNAYRNYSNNTSALSKNLEKLSSGYKINRAGDDAAGLAISEKMRAQITGLEGAQSNAKDGISLVQTAEGALTEVHDMLNRMYSLAEQSANGTYENETDRAQLQKEVKNLKDEINRIADSTNFNGINLLDGSLAGSGNISGKGLVITDVAATAGTATTEDFATLSAAMTDGDKISYTVSWKDADGKEYSANVELTYDDATKNFVAADGSTYTANADGKATVAQQQDAIIGELNKNKDFTAAFTVSKDGDALKFTSNIKGANGPQITAVSRTTIDDTGAATAVADGGSIASTTSGADAMQKVDLSKLGVLAGDGTDTASDISDAIFEIGGKKFVLAESTATDEDLANIGSDVTVIKLAGATWNAGNDAANAAATIGRVTGMDFSANGSNEIMYKGDEKLTTKGGLELQIGDTGEDFNQLTVSVDDCHTAAIGIDGLDIGTQAGAKAALKTIESAINYVSDVRGGLGATQNRLDHTINNLSVMQENIQDAESSIRDTDVAEEMMSYTKNNILIQSAQAMLAQANQVPQGVLQLLQ